MNNIGTTPKVLGLDISTKTIGWALFDIQKKQLLELTHFSPKVKPKREDKIEEMLNQVPLKTFTNPQEIAKLAYYLCINNSYCLLYTSDAADE